MSSQNVLPLPLFELILSVPNVDFRMGNWKQNANPVDDIESFSGFAFCCMFLNYETVDKFAVFVIQYQ